MSSLLSFSVLMMIMTLIIMMIMIPIVGYIRSSFIIPVKDSLASNISNGRNRVVGMIATFYYNEFIDDVIQFM